MCTDVIDEDYVCRCPALRFTGRQCQRRQLTFCLVSVCLSVGQGRNQKLFRGMFFPFPVLTFTFGLLKFRSFVGTPKKPPGTGLSGLSPFLNYSVFG